MQNMDNPNQELIDDLYELDTKLDMQIKVISNQALKEKVSVFDQRFIDGKYVLTPLLCAKAQTLNALAMLQLVQDRRSNGLGTL